jgi:lysozyme
MNKPTSFINGKLVLLDQVVETNLRVENGLIASIGEDALNASDEIIDLKGDYLMPGLVEIHTDNLERHLMPRPKVYWEELPALLAHDADQREHDGGLVRESLLRRLRQRRLRLGLGWLGLCDGLVRGDVGGVVGGAVVIAAGLIAGQEGFVDHVYLDPVKIPSYCFGETQNPDWKKTYSREECVALLEGRVMEFDEGVSACVAAPIPDPTRAAFLSASYNLGLRGFCGSSIVRLWNAGHRREACDRLLKFNTAGGIVLRGLTRRREAERALCLQGLG